MDRLLVTVCLLLVPSVVFSLDGTPANNQTTSKLTPAQKVASSSLNRNNDLYLNTIPGSSDYVPDNNALEVRSNQLSHISNFVASKHNPSALNTTRSQANVFEATASSTNGTSQKDPLLVNAQSPNPFLAGGPGGMNPQIAMMLQQNPRLQMLARQNPIIAQQIMRNPGLLRDPQIQRAIQSQLAPGQQQNLLGQLGQIGLLRALNPLGLGLNPMMNRQQQLNPMVNQQQQNALNQQSNPLNQNSLNNNRQGYGLPRSNVPNNNQETLPGGYFGNNGNYNANNPSAENANSGEGEGGAGEEGGDNSGEAGAGENGSPDYEDNSGADPNAGGGGGEEGGNAGEDSQQGNPAEDPDIQQLQNFGGPVNDNFPEGLFPPGLLSKEDIAEIRKQQEKEAKEAAERERQQQEQQQNQQGGGQGEGQDYDGSGEDGSNAGAEGGGEEVPVEGGAQEGSGGTDDGSANNGETTTENGAGAGSAQGQQDETERPALQFIGNQGHNQAHQPNTNPMVNQNTAGYGTTTMAPAYHNAYQPIQPVQQSPRVPLQPSVNYASDYPAQVTGQNMANHKGNQFNYQPGVEYDQPGQQLSNYPMMTTTPSPISIGSQYGRSPMHSPMNTFNSGPQHQQHQYQQQHQPQSFGQYNSMNRPYNGQQLRQPMRPWQSPQPQYNPNGAFNGGAGGYNSLHSNRMGPTNGGALGHNSNELNNDDPSGFSTPSPAYRSNMFNEPRPFQQRHPRPFLS